MERHVGAILRETRKRRRVELPEVEAATRIRLKYLLAIEEGDWGVLPGGVYTRGFIRTYASFLGLDGERLAAEYRRDVEGTPGGGSDWAQGTAVRQATRSRGPVPGLAWIAIAAVLVVAAVAIFAIPVGEDDGQAPPRPVGNEPPATVETKEPAPARPTATSVSVSLLANAEVWVCLLDEGDRHLVDGQILEAGAEAGPFRSGSFIVSLGNGEVSMLVNGKEAEIPATPSPIGYSIDAEGELTRVPEAERPTCA
jgi:hypothetical protein